MSVKSKTQLDIWNGHPMHLIGLSGLANSGKSYLAATLAPQATLYLDCERSAEAYKPFGFTHRDIRSITRTRIKRAPTPKDLFDTILLETKDIKLGDYAIVVLDPLTGTVEQGIVEYVASNYAKYGFKSEATFTASQGLFWSRVRNQIEEFLLDLADRCTTVVFIAQMKTVYRDGQATKDKEPQGKKTLFDLASLYLLLSRTSVTRHAPPPLIPAAQVLKSHTLRPFPPRLPEATYKSILHYLTNGLTDGKLSEEEQVIEAPLTADEKLQLQATIEETKLEVATAELERAKIDERVVDAREAARKKFAQVEA